MFEKINKKYDPVTASVPGIDQKLVEEERQEIFLAGDPLPPKPLLTKEKIIFQRPGIKITR